MDYTPEMMNRIKRIEGQIRGIIRMMEDGKHCKEIVGQMQAARKALDRLMAVIVSKNLEVCLREQIEKGEDTREQIEEAINLLVKSR